ncbi:flagellar assembly protein FliW [Isoptericola sp. NPDC057391]|uniref:flagellar assembly protein FliW n=1 Tax=Isoptericola sp. NPDC057391 TaxID=3346117 RepID=UPI00363C477B
MTTLTFLTPLPGLGARLFELVTEPADGVYTLVALDAPGVQVLALDPALWVPDFAPAVPVADLARLGLDPADRSAPESVGPLEPVVLVVASARDGALTVNLMAPLLVHPVTGAAVQTILEGQGLDLRRTLVPA